MKKNALLLLAFVGAMGALAYRGGWFDRSTPQSLQPGNPSSAGAGPGLRPAPLTSVSLAVPRTLDMTHVAPAHFAVALGKDPGRIFAFVRDQIAFEAYSGGLRGPRGTLLAMAGNSVDRAALLGSLLVQSGQRVRYVHGTLPKELARSLVTSMWGERRLPPPSSADEERSPSLAAAMETFGNGVRRDYTLIRDRLKRARLAGASGIAPDLDSLVREAEAHYWVQWWKNGSWFDLDPSFAEAVPGQTFAPPGQASDTLPETLFHQVTLRLRLEESGILVEGDGDVKPVIRDILTYKARAADLSGLDM